MALESSEYHQPLSIVKFDWKVVNFTNVRPVMAKVAKSPTFLEGQKRQWFIQLRPRGEEGDPDTNLHVGLKEAEVGRASVRANYTLKFIDEDRKVKKMLTSGGYDFIPGGLAWGWTLADPTGIFADSGDLLVQLEITTSLMPPGNSLKASRLFTFPITTLTEDLRKVNWSGDTLDIESADGQVFHAHKDLLAVRIPNFFGLMFNSGMIETQKNRVKLDFDADVVGLLLHYCYADEFANTGAMASRLLPAAHQYQMDRLVAICAAQLADQLSLANMAEILRIAELFGLPQLTSACNAFINQQDKMELFKLIKAEAYENHSRESLQDQSQVKTEASKDDSCPSLPDLQDQSQAKTEASKDDSRQNLAHQSQQERFEVTGWRGLFCGLL